MSYKDLINERYSLLTENRFIAGGFKARDANKYKYWKKERIQNIIAIKKRCDKLMIMLDYDYPKAWELSSKYSEEQINNLIKSQI